MVHSRFFVGLYGSVFSFVYLVILFLLPIVLSVLGSLSTDYSFYAFKKIPMVNQNP